MTLPVSLLVASAVIFAVYVAVEATVGLWAGTILVLGRDLPQEAAGLCVTAYYASITVGRVLVGFVVDRWGGRRLVHLGLGVALASRAGPAPTPRAPHASDRSGRTATTSLPGR